MEKENLNVENFTEQEMMTYAPQLREYGKVSGLAICCVKSDNIDLKYKEKRNANSINELCTNIPVKKYFVESFIVGGFQLKKAANGSPVIMFNGRSALTFPLSADTNETLLSATESEIHDAIREFEATGKVKFFTDIKLCTKVAQSLNEMNSDQLNKLAESLMNQASSLSTLNKTMSASLNEYMKTLE